MTHSLKIIQILIIGLLLFCIGCQNHQRQQINQFLLLHNINVIDGTGAKVKSNQDVLISAGMIKQLGAVGSFSIPRNTTTIDYSGKFLVPGFIDLHVHFPSDEAVQKLMLNRLLEYGVTTILNPGARLNAGVELRKRISKGQVVGPRMFTSGIIIEYERTVENILNWAVEVADEQMIINEVKHQASTGVDFIKLYSGLPPKLVEAAINEASKHGVKVIGHMGKTLWKQAAELGIDMLVHSGWGTPMDEIVNLSNTEQATDTEWYHGYHDAINGVKFKSLTQALLKHKVTVVPTLSIHQASGLGKDNTLLPLFETDIAPDANHPGWWGENWQKVHPQYAPDSEEEANMMDTVYFPAILKILKSYYDAGVRIGVGTDVGNAWMTPGVVFHHELELYQEAGIPPLEIIKMATMNGAEFLNISDQTGTIAVNKSADFIVLNQDPSQNIKNTRSIEAVYQHGKKHGR